MIAVVLLLNILMSIILVRLYYLVYRPYSDACRVTREFLYPLFVISNIVTYLVVITGITWITR